MTDADRSFWLQAITLALSTLTTVALAAIAAWFKYKIDRVNATAAAAKVSAEEGSKKVETLTKAVDGRLTLLIQAIHEKAASDVAAATAQATIDATAAEQARKAMADALVVQGKIDVARAANEGKQTSGG